MIHSRVSMTKGFDHFYKFMAADGRCFLGKTEYRIGPNGNLQELIVRKDMVTGDVVEFRDIHSSGLANQMDKLFLKGPTYQGQPHSKAKFHKGELIYIKDGSPKDLWWITDVVSGVYFLKSDRKIALLGLCEAFGYMDVDVADTLCTLDHEFQMRRDLDAIINGDE